MDSEHLSQGQADEFAIGALDETSAALVAMHAARCDRCRALVHEAEGLAAALALTAPRRLPPARLRDRVMAVAGITWRGRFSRVMPLAAASVAVAVAAAAAIAVVFINGDVQSLRQSNDALRAQVADLGQQKAAIASVTTRLGQETQASFDLARDATGDRDLLLAMLSPSSYVADVYSIDPSMPAVGRLVWDKEQSQVWFVAGNLTPRPPGQTYQLWVDAGDRYISLGTFNSDSSGFVRFETTLPRDLTSYTSAVVTIEQADGSPSRSGPVVFVSDLTNLKH